MPFRMDGEFSFGQYNRKVNMNLSFGAGNQAEQRGSPNGPEAVLRLPEVVGRVEMWRGGRRFGLSVAAPFVWRCPMG